MDHKSLNPSVRIFLPYCTQLNMKAKCSLFSLCHHSFEHTHKETNKMYAYIEEKATETKMKSIDDIILSNMKCFLCLFYLTKTFTRILHFLSSFLFFFIFYSCIFRSPIGIFSIIYFPISMLLLFFFIIFIFLPSNNSTCRFSVGSFTVSKDKTSQSPTL